MSQVIIISDICANLEALELLLDEVDKNYDVTHIINMGNFVTSGPNPCEVFDLIMKDKRFITVLGINDFEIAHEKFFKKNYEGEVTEEQLLFEKLGQQRIEKLKKIDTTSSIELYGKKFFLMPCEYEKKYEEEDFRMKLRVSQVERNNLIELHDFFIVNDVHIHQIYEDYHDKIFMRLTSMISEKNIVKFVVIDFHHNRYEVQLQRLEYNFSKIKKEIYDDYYDKINYSANIYSTYDWSFYKPTMEILLARAKKIKLSCFVEQKNIINEIKRNLEIIEKKQYINGQLTFIVKNTPVAKNILINNYLDEKDRIKWFSIYTIDKDNSFSCIEHFGDEIHLFNMSKKELDFIRAKSHKRRVKIDIFEDRGEDV